MTTASASCSLGWQINHASPRLSVSNSSNTRSQSAQTARVCLRNDWIKSQRVRCYRSTFITGRRVIGQRREKTSLQKCRGRPIEAKSNPIVETVVNTGKTGLNLATDLVPASVPRPVARGGVVVVASFVALSVAKSILSTAISLVLVGGLAYAAFTYAKSNDDSGGSDGGSSKGDPLSEAKRIMDKYK